MAATAGGLLLSGLLLVAPHAVWATAVLAAVSASALARQVPPPGRHTALGGPSALAWPGCSARSDHETRLRVGLPAAGSSEAAAGAAGAAAGVEAGAEHAAASAPSRPAVKLPKWHAAAEQWMDDGVSFLLNTERKFGCKGSWVSDATAFYTRYHAAYCGIVGLLELGDATARPPQSARAEGGDAEHEAEGAVPPQLCSYIVPRPFVVADMSTALAPPVSLERLVATMSG